MERYNPKAGGMVADVKGDWVEWAEVRNALWEVGNRPCDKCIDEVLDEVLDD